MTGAGRYAPALGNETLHGRTLWRAVLTYMFYESKMIFYRKAIYSNIKLVFSR